MSYVMFACICDHCKARSEEYSAWPTCRECELDTCTACGSDRDTDYSYEGPEDGWCGHDEITCHTCRDALAAEEGRIAYA